MATVQVFRTSHRSGQSAKLLVGLLLLVALAVAVRAMALGSQSFWSDEVFTLRVIQGPLGGILDRLAGSESTPPLYYLLAKGWGSVFGYGEVPLRSLSLVLGVALVPTVFYVGFRSGGPRTALMAAALVATNPELAWMSQDARSYSLVVLLAVGSVAVFLLLRERFTQARFLAWVLVATAAAASHYFAIFVVLPQLVWIAIQFRWKAWWGILAFALGVAALVPLAAEQRSTNASLAIGGQSLVTRISGVPKNFLAGEKGGEFDQWVLLGAAAALMLAGLVLAVAATSAVERRKLVPVALIAAFGFGVPLLAALVGLDYVNARNLLPAWPLFLVLVAAGCAAASVGRVGLVVCGAICAIGLAVWVHIARNPGLQRDDWRSAAQTIARSTDTRTLVLVDELGGSAPLAHYLSATPVVADAVGTREVAVVSLVRGRSRRVFTPPAPFRLTAVERSPSVIVQFFEAPRRQLVTRAQLQGAAWAQGSFVPEELISD